MTEPHPFRDDDLRSWDVYSSCRVSFRVAYSHFPVAPQAYWPRWARSEQCGEPDVVGNEAVRETNLAATAVRHLSKHQVSGRAKCRRRWETTAALCSGKKGESRVTSWPPESQSARIVARASSKRATGLVYNCDVELRRLHACLWPHSRFAYNNVRSAVREGGSARRPRLRCCPSTTCRRPRPLRSPCRNAGASCARRSPGRRCWGRTRRPTPRV
jgi:hypothetical protein